MIRKLVQRALAGAAIAIALTSIPQAKCQISLQCETTFSSNTCGYIQMYNGAEQDFYFYNLSASQVRVHQSPCAGTVLWEYPIPAQYQSSTYRYLTGQDVTGDGTSDFILQIHLSDRGVLLVVNSVNDQLLLTLNDAGIVYYYGGFADVDDDGLGEILAVAFNQSLTQYKYQVWNTNGAAGIAPVDLPSNFSLSPAFPNPFNSAVSIPFELEHPGDVEIVVYDVLGHEIANLSKANASYGAQTVEWDARMMPSGSYFYSVFVNQVPIGGQRVILLR